MAWLRGRVFERLLDGFAAGLTDAQLVPLLVAELGAEPADDADTPAGGAGGPDDRDGPDDESGSEDGGPEDGGPEDGGPEDGGPEDGGPEDGGPEDGGPEAPMTARGPDGPDGPDDGGSDEREPAGDAPDSRRRGRAAAERRPRRRRRRRRADHGPGPAGGCGAGRDRGGPATALDRPGTRRHARTSSRGGARCSPAPPASCSTATATASGGSCSPTTTAACCRSCSHAAAPHDRRIDQPAPTGPKTGGGQAATPLSSSKLRQRCWPPSPPTTTAPGPRCSTNSNTDSPPSTHPTSRPVVRPTMRSTPAQARRRRPGAEVDRWVRVRDRQCVAPGCRRPAYASDLDHTLDHALGGPSLSWNCGVWCRHHHRTKHEGGWRVTQPSPGRFHITTRAGARHIVEPPRIIEPLPAPHPGDEPRPLPAHETLDPDDERRRGRPPRRPRTVPPTGDDRVDSRHRTPTRPGPHRPAPTLLRRGRTTTAPASEHPGDQVVEAIRLSSSPMAWALSR